MCLVSTFKVEAYDTVPKVFYSVPSPIANDGVFCRNEQSDMGILQWQTMALQSGISLAERLPLIHSVKGNKALLLTKVTKEPAELAILLELLMFEKVLTQQHLEHEQKKEGEIIGSKNDFFSKRERASDT